MWLIIISTIIHIHSLTISFTWACILSCLYIGQMFEGDAEMMLKSIDLVKTLPGNSLIFPGGWMLYGACEYSIIMTVYCVLKQVMNMHLIM